MGQPTQRATNYTARSNIEPAQIFLHANGIDKKRPTEKFVSILAGCSGNAPVGSLDGVGQRAEAGEGGRADEVVRRL